MNALLSIILSVAAIVMGVILTFIVIRKRCTTIKKPHSRKQTAFTIATVAIAAASLATGTVNTAITGSIIFDATTKGATTKQISSLTANELKSYSKNSIAVSHTTFKSQPGDIIILTKYGCPDCAAIKDDLFAYIKKNDIKNVTFVDSQSTYGEKLVKHLSVQKIPCAIYVRHNALSNGADMNWTAIYASNEEGKTIFNENAFAHIVNLQKAEK